MDVFLKKVIADSSDSEDTSSTPNSEDSDIEELYFLNKANNAYHPVQNYYEQFIPTYTADEFKSHFRISRTSVQGLLENLQMSYLSVGQGRSPVPFEKALLLTIWTLSNQECYRSIADRFGIRKGNAHTITIKVCMLLYRKCNNYIIWPKEQKAVENVENFNKLRGPNSFPNVFGCVDGTHILIPGPQEDNSYFNRKGTHSVIAQIICDSNLQIINVSCGWPGSYHDARVWKSSRIYEKLSENANEMLPPRTHLLGDSAYPLSNFVITPFRDNGHLTNQQKRFNRKLSSTRVVVENTIGRLKGLFRRLKYLNVVNLKYVKFFIIASVVLHNISIKDGVTFEECTSENQEEIHDLPFDGIENPQANELRMNIMRNIC